MLFYLGVVHLVRTQNFPKNQHFLPPDTHTYVCVSGGKYVSFSGDFANVLNGLPLKMFKNAIKILKIYFNDTNYRYYCNNIQI